MAHLINVNTLPEKSKHIAWKVHENDNFLILDEIIENYYQHPDTMGVALLPKIEIKRIKAINKNSKKAAPLWQIKIAEDSLDLCIDEIKITLP